MMVPKGKSDMFATLVYDKDLSKLSDFCFQEVPVVTLKSIVQSYIRHEYILLIDIEGHEDKVLKQIPDCNTMPILVVAENNSNGLLGTDHLRSMMISYGYYYLGRLGPNDDLFIHQIYFDCISLHALTNA